MRSAILYGFSALLPGLCFGQGLESASATLGSSGGVKYQASFTFRPQPFEVPVVLGAPYSAEEVSDELQTLDNGVRTEGSQQGRRLYRDSSGRTRVERHLLMGPNVADPPLVVEIDDPAAGYRYTLDLYQKVVHRSIPPQPGAEPIAAAHKAVEAAVASVAGSKPVDAAESASTVPAKGTRRDPVVATLHAAEEPVPERLATRVMDGLTVEGTRYTLAIPAGAGPPRVTTSEVWTSPELHLTVLSKFTDSQGAERTIRLKNLNRSEPDPSLFQVPPDYTVQDEPGEFRINFTIAK